MKCNDLSKIKNPYGEKYMFNYSNKKRYKEVEGVDTETLKGYCKLFLYTDKNKKKYKYTNNLNDLFKLIFSLDKNNLYFFHNIGYDSKAIFKNLFYEIKKGEKRSEFLRYFMQGYRIIINPSNKNINKNKKNSAGYVLNLPNIKYKSVIIQNINKKFCSFSNLSKTIYFYDTLQFYDNMSLNDAALLNLNVCKNKRCRSTDKIKKNIGLGIFKIEKNIIKNIFQNLKMENM